MPIRVTVTAGTTADCTQATALIDGFAAQILLADRGYDSNEIIDKPLESCCQVGLPPKKNRKVQRDYDKKLYHVRYLVENAFLHLKRLRSTQRRPGRVKNSSKGIRSLAGLLGMLLSAFPIFVRPDARSGCSG